MGTGFKTKDNDPRSPAHDTTGMMQLLARKIGEWRIQRRRRTRPQRFHWWTYCIWCCCCRRCLASNQPPRQEQQQKVRGLPMGSDSEAATGSLEPKIGSENLDGIINRDVIPPPEHLVILVNGIIGSSNDWRFAAEQFRTRLGRHIAIHCSESSASLQTFDGVDIMGRRLADEVREIIDKTPGVTKISFVAHSLGGLVIRYAISQLYCPPRHNDNNGEGVQDPSVNSKMMTAAALSEFTIGGLQPENFITLATPHLGCRGSKQLPFLLGIQAFEKTAPYFAHWFVGQTGKHLFLTDGTSSEPPLLTRMAKDCKEGQFISSLRAFKTRTAYANVVNDQMVGWRTASIRRKSEMPEIKHDPLDPKYPHIVREEEYIPPAEDLTVKSGRPSLPDIGQFVQDSFEGVPVSSTETVRQICRTDSFEEEIVEGLTQMPWYRVDVSFRGVKGAYQAHNLIQVKNSKVHVAGADVIDHIIDKHFIKAQEVSNK